MEDTQKHCTGGEIKKTRQPSSMGLIIRQKEPTNLETPLTLVPANVEWNEKNQTYAFAYGLGAVIVLYGLMLCLHPWLPQVAALGGFLVFVMSLLTLSFLVTTPACWVPALGDVNHGFPFLSGAGRLVIKDAIMMGAALPLASVKETRIFQ